MDGIITLDNLIQHNNIENTTEIINDIVNNDIATEIINDIVNNDIADDDIIVTEIINDFAVSSSDDIAEALKLLDIQDTNNDNNDDIYVAFNKSIKFYNSKISLSNCNEVSIFQKIESMLDKPINEFFDKILETPARVLDTDVNNKLEDDIGISVSELDNYIGNYKVQIQEYFNKIMVNEIDIIDAAIRQRKLLNYTKSIKDLTQREKSLYNNSNNLMQSTYFLNEYINEITNNELLNKLKNEYNFNKKCFAKLMTISQQVNSINETHKCIICTTHDVDTFMNPCGHTGCSECIKKHLYDRPNQYSRQKRDCYLCKTPVLSINKIYYS
jgi:hypothetical protein